MAVSFLLLLASFAFAESETFLLSYDGNDKVSARLNKNCVARSRFTVSLNETGWNELHIITDSHEGKFSDTEQMYGAGFLEGYTTAKYIVAALTTARKVFRATYPGNWKGDATDFPTEVYDYVLEQWEWLKTQVKQPGDEKEKWAHVGLVVPLVEGMTNGVRKAGAGKYDWFELKHVLALNSYLDIADLVDGELIKPADQKEAPAQSYAPRIQRCSALTVAVPKGKEAPKSVADLADVFFAHDTWDDYFFMNRILKQRTLDLSDKSAAHTVVESSSPGLVYSSDDFYVSSHELAVLETTSVVFKRELFQRVVKQALPTWARSFAAVRFARNGAEFHDHIAFHSSGTYNNGFQVLDRKALAEKVPEGSVLLSITEQMPGKVVYEDRTNQLLEKGFVPGVNAPLVPEFFDALGYKDREERNDFFLSLEKGPRYHIFARDAPAVKTLDDFKSLMRYAEFTKEEVPTGDGTMAHDPGSVILARTDLRLDVLKDEKGAEHLGKRLYGQNYPRTTQGGIDTKIVSLSSLAKANFSQRGMPGLNFTAISGPAHGFKLEDGSTAKPFSFSDLGAKVVDGKVQKDPAMYSDMLKDSLLPAVFNFDWMTFSSLGEQSFLPATVEGFIYLVALSVTLGLASAIAAVVIECRFSARRKRVSAFYKPRDGPLLGDAEERA